MSTKPEPIPFNQSVPLLLTAAETARLLSLSRSKIYMMIRSGELEVRRFGTAVRIPMTEVLRLSEGKAA